MSRETFSKHKFNKISSKFPGQPQTTSWVLLEKILRARDDAIHDKKAEICELREKNGDLRLVINMMIRGINQMEVIQ